VDDYEAVIGLEFHLQLKTKTKLFCSCRNLFGGDPNVRTCPVCLGLPGALPVLNRDAVRLALLAALALEAVVHRESVFHRKNYFYPDLPKGYQITQYTRTLASDGTLRFEGGEARVERMNLEEEAAKSTYTGEGEVLLDFNRSGIPLLEIVTAPDLRSPREARRCAEALRQIIRYLEISDCDMEKGQLRADSNLSVRPRGSRTLGTKVELKNLNSFRAVEDALEYEYARQVKLLRRGSRVRQETRLWDDDAEVTRAMRSKEEEHDYRYFPDPDLLPLLVDEELIESARRALPELPEPRRRRLQDDHGLPENLARVICSEKDLADYYEDLAARVQDQVLSANWVANQLLYALNENETTVEEFWVRPADLAELLSLVQDGTITGNAAKSVFDRMVGERETALTIVERERLSRVRDESLLREVVSEVLREYSEAVEKYREGKTGVLKFLIGEAMKKTEGRADPEILRKILKRSLE
jgi:aspartyl-tRNA(Asn)/glutamyl-tRNA(Gln) amidotransferase subunit B